MNASACRIPPEGGGGVAPGVFPCRFGEYANQTAGGDDEPTLRSSRTYVQIRPVFRLFSDPVPVPLPVCHQCEPCGCSLHNGTGHHSPVSLTGSTRQPSWRVRPGSVRHLGGQRFHSDDTVADVRSIFPLTRGQVIRGPRYHALSGGTAPVLQQYSHILYRLFLPVLCGSLSRALLTSSSCSALTSPQIIQLTATLRATAFFWLQGGVFHGEGVPVTDDDGATVATGGEPEDRLPAHCNDRCPAHVVSAEPQPVQLHDAVFQNGYRTASGAVFSI